MIIARAPRWIFTILTVMLILWLTLAPQPLGEVKPMLFEGADKVVHAIMFGFLLFIIFFDKVRKGGRQGVSMRFVFLSGTGVIAFGIAIEYLQEWEGLGRSFDVLDIIADIIGIMLVMLSGLIYFVKKGWLRWLFRIVLGFLLVLILLPVSLYIPPIQTALKNIACRVLKDSSGMDISLDKLRVRFPIDVELQGMSLRDASGELIAKAKSANLAVKFLPLLKLDIDIEKLRLNDAYYKMISPDSSMILKIQAGYIEIDDKSSVDLKKNEVNVNHLKMERGRISLLMDVWKQKPQPESSDSASAPLHILLKDSEFKDVSFGMSMLPTIYRLSANLSDTKVKNAEIDLGNNCIRWEDIAILGGAVNYTAPTAEWVASHPAPPAIPSSGPPMTIKGEHIGIEGFRAIYAIQGVRPTNGFNPNYISFSDLSLELKNFYNQSAKLELPLVSLHGRERSGLTITEGRGLVAINENGLSFGDMDVHTLYSYLRGDADVPFALMEMKPNARIDVNLTARVGMPDIEAAMPTIKRFTKSLSTRNPLDIKLNAKGTLANLNVDNLDISLREIVELKGSGEIKNPLNLDRLTGSIKFFGALNDPRYFDKFLGKSGISLPSLRIDGEAKVNSGNYFADFRLITPVGRLAAEGSVGVNSERYELQAFVNNVDLGYFLRGSGLGQVTGGIKASGRGFNPEIAGTYTSAEVDLNSIVVNNQTLRNITGNVELQSDGNFQVNVNSWNPNVNLDLRGSGRINRTEYEFDIISDIRDLNIAALGWSKDKNEGHGEISARGKIDPSKMLFDVEMKVNNLDWSLGEHVINLPEAMTLKTQADANYMMVDINSLQSRMLFKCEAGFNSAIKSFSTVATELAVQIDKRDLKVDEISRRLPHFSLNVNALGGGLLKQLLTPYGLSLSALKAEFCNDSLIRGDVKAMGFNSETLSLDTMSLALRQRNKLLDYKLHVGNKPGTLDQFAQLNLNGYLGANRLGAFLTQKDIENRVGYKIGLTASMVDSIVSLHFTPLSLSIAYLPWELNEDNYIDYNIVSKKVDANLLAKSNESSILLQTEPNLKGNDELHMKLDHIKIEDFLNLSIFAPPVSGCVDSDLRVLYADGGLSGSGSVEMHDFIYNHIKVGDFNIGLKAAMDFKGFTNVSASMDVNHLPVAKVYARLQNDSTGLRPDSVGMALTRMPLSILNPFLDQNALLEGYLNGNMTMGGTFTKPLIDGYLSFDSVMAKIPIASSVLSFDNRPVEIEKSNVKFDEFKILGKNKNPLLLKGNVDLSNLSDIRFNLGLDGKNVQLVGTGAKDRSDVRGRLFIDLSSSLRGSMSRMDVRANLNILNTTDLFYNLGMAPQQMIYNQTSDVVKFLNFNDTAAVAKADSLESNFAMRVRAGLIISPGARFKIQLDQNEQDRIELQPTADLNYYQNFMGDARLSGSLTTGAGSVQYKVPMLGEKLFTFNPSSMVKWSGDLMTPSLNIIAYDDIRSNVSGDGGTRPVNFVVTLNVGGQLPNPTLSFELTSNDDMAIRNELQSMSADQRQTQAMNLLLYGQYMGMNSHTSGDNLNNIGSNMLYGFMESTLNQWASRAIKGVDLSFGIDQFEYGENGAVSTQTSYSYQVSKTLFNNRFKIQVGGNYSTDIAEDESIGQNLFNNVSAEYILRQGLSTNMLIKLFRHTGYESILEGEVTETGVGFVMKKKMQSIKSLFRRGKRIEADSNDSIVRNGSNIRNRRLAR